MKKTTPLACVIAAGFSLLLLSGCKKLLDYITPGPDDKSQHCRIERVTSNFMDTYGNEEGVFKDTAWFAYNAQGNPISIKHRYSAMSDAIYTLDMKFKYDHKKRLVVFLENANVADDVNVFAFFWHKYTYVGDYLIIDSTFTYASGNWNVSDRPELFDEVGSPRVTVYELDFLGRVKTEKSLGVNLLYNYDANGNLVNPGVSYSNKINIRQTNKVWMFISRDYSINSPAGDASQYNGERLPVKLNAMPYFIGGFNFEFNDIEVKYKCK